MNRGYICLPVCAVAFVAAPASARPVDFSVPRGPLGEAAIAIARQAGVSISISDPALSREPVRAFDGRMSVEAAIRRAIRGKPAEFVRLAPGAFRIDRTAEIRRPPTLRPKHKQKLDAATDERPIVVVGTKRRMLARDVPGSLNVIELDRVGTAARSGGSEILVRLDSGLGSTHLGPGRNKLFIRGIADSSFNGQTQATIGEYLGEARLNYNAVDPDLRLYDVRAVEILPGPQGTLYGAGTIGGVIRIDPVEPQPDCSCGSIESAGGMTAHGAPSGEIAGILNLPLASQRASMRALAYAIEDGGYIDNVLREERDVNRVRTVGGRVTARFSPSPNMAVSAMLAGQWIRAADGQYADRDVGPWQRATPYREPFATHFLLGNVSLEAASGPYRIVATASAVRQKLFETFDASHDGTPLILSQRNATALQSGELRVSKDASSGGWLAGISLVHNLRRRGDFEGAPTPLASHPDLRNSLHEATAFGEATWKIAPAIEVVAGGRATRVWTEGKLDGQAGISSSEFHLLPSALVSLQIIPGARLFAQLQESFRPGGYILRSGKSLHLDSDKARSFEAGLRFEELAGLAITGGVSASHTRWSKVQVDLIDADGFPSTTNLGDGRIWTIDAHVETLLAPDLQLRVGATRNRSTMSGSSPSFVPPDNSPLPNVPDLSAQASVRASKALRQGRRLNLTGWLRYVGKSTLGIGPGLDRRQGSYLDSGVEADLIISRVDLFASLTNILDRSGNRFALGSILALDRMNQVTPLRPRTLRLGASLSF